MLVNGQLGASHPFMVGLAMETAIHYYDMTVAEGHPDYRIPAMVKHALDALWSDYYVAGTHAFRYTRWDLPTTDDWTVLNNLVAPAYAWYWNLTGDAPSMSRGDDLFQNALNDPSNNVWEGKEFSQLYKWSFDYVRWRSGNDTSAVAQVNNPLTGPYPDTEPPIMGGSGYTAVKVSVTPTTASITYGRPTSLRTHRSSMGSRSLLSAAIDIAGQRSKGNDIPQCDTHKPGAGNDISLPSEIARCRKEPGVACRRYLRHNRRIKIMEAAVRL